MNKNQLIFNLRECINSEIIFDLVSELKFNILIYE